MGDRTVRDPEGGHDVVVAGAGNAALTAALAAAEAGARVLVLEKAPRAERGGNSRFSGGLFRFAYRDIQDIRAVLPSVDPATVVVEPYPPDAYYRDTMRVTEGLADPELTRVLVDESLPTMLWMGSLGVRWELSEIFGVRVGDVTHYPPGAVIQALHAGVGLVHDLFGAVERRGIPIRYETAVRRLLSEGGRVSGVVVDGPGGEEAIRAGALILAAGGFEANGEMRRRHLGPEWERVKVRGTRFDTGEVLAAALEIGAQAVGEWDGCHATPIDANAPSPGELALTDKTNRLSYPFGIMVNERGERFADEGESLATHTYAKTGRAILAQPEAIAFQVFDRQTLHLLEPRYSTGTPIRAETLEELADRLGVPRARLATTVRAFNEAVNDVPFDPTILDGKSTTGLTPPKSNWAVPLNRPPYVAYAVTCGITFTYGGVKIDAAARVLDRQGAAIPGLFATGEMTGGFFYRNYPGGAGLMRGAVFGRIAGRNAARESGVEGGRGAPAVKDAQRRQIGGVGRE